MLRNTIALIMVAVLAGCVTARTATKTVDCVGAFSPLIVWAAQAYSGQPGTAPAAVYTGQCGAYCPQWDRKLKERIRARAGYVCRWCGRKPAATLHVHHIDYCKGNCHPCNLIALCPTCHGRTNGGPANRAKWQNKLSTMMTGSCVSD